MTEDPRIGEIRAELDQYDGSGSAFLSVDEHDENLLDRIRAILDCPAPAPRVWFPGDDIPADRVVVAEHAVIYAYDANEQSWDDIGGPVVEIPVPSPEEWQAAIDRAEAKRADAEWQHTEGTNP